MGRDRPDDVDPDVRDPGSELAKAPREIEDEASRSTSSRSRRLRGDELVTDVRHRDDSEDAAEDLRAGLAERLGQSTYTESGESIEEVDFRLLGYRTIALPSPATGGLSAGRLNCGPAFRVVHGVEWSPTRRGEDRPAGVEPELTPLPR